MDDCNLQKLGVKPGKLTPVFHKDTTEYNVTVGSEVAKITFDCLTSDTGASYGISVSFPVVVMDAVMLTRSRTVKLSDFSQAAFNFTSIQSIDLCCAHSDTTISKVHVLLHAYFLLFIDPACNNMHILVMFIKNSHLLIYIFFFDQIRAFPFYKAYWRVRFVECRCAKYKGKFMVGCVQLVKDKNQNGD